MRSHSKQQGGGKNKDETQSWSLPQTCQPQGSQVLWNGSIWYHPLKYGQGMVPGTFSQLVSKTFHCLY